MNALLIIFALSVSIVSAAHSRKPLQPAISPSYGPQKDPIKRSPKKFTDHQMLWANERVSYYRHRKIITYDIYIARTVESLLKEYEDMPTDNSDDFEKFEELGSLDHNSIVFFKQSDLVEVALEDTGIRLYRLNPSSRNPLNFFIATPEMLLTLKYSV